MKKLNFSQTELIADIHRQFTNNSNALNSGIPARNLPVLTFKQPVEDIQTAMEISSTAWNMNSFPSKRLKEFKAKTTFLPSCI